MPIVSLLKKQAFARRGKLSPSAYGRCGSPYLVRRSGELGIVRTDDPFRFAAQTLRHKKAPETEASSAMGRCVGEGRLYRPIQASGLSGDVSRRNWKWSVQLPVPSPATLPSVWRVPTC